MQNYGNNVVDDLYLFQLRHSADDDDVVVVDADDPFLFQLRNSGE